MPSHASFDLVWRSVEDELDDRATDGAMEIVDHALWSEFFHGDRRYEVRVTSGPGISCLIQLDQSAVDGAVDADLIEADEEYGGGCWLSVEFCVHGPASEPVDQRLLHRVVEEFWPDVDIHHESLVEAPHQDAHARPAREEPVEEIHHNHFRFSWPVSFDFAERVGEFVDAVVETMNRLETSVPPGRMV